MDVRAATYDEAITKVFRVRSDIAERVVMQLNVALLVTTLAEIYMMCGGHEKTVDHIETLLSVPSAISAGLLRVDPIWDPIRNHPKFRRLAQGKQAARVFPLATTPVLL